MGESNNRRSRRKEKVSNAAPFTEAAVSELVRELISCPRQPGRLRISRKACGRRYLLAGAKEDKVPFGDFEIALRWSLDICRSCPEGRINLLAASQGYSRGMKLNVPKSGL